MINIIKSTSKELLKSDNKLFSNSMAIEQFLSSQILQPDRLFIRLINKNFKKSKKIKELFIKHNIYDKYISKNNNWLLDIDNIQKILNFYFENINKEINKINWNNLFNQKTPEKFKQLSDQILDNNNKTNLFYFINLGRLFDMINKLIKSGSLEDKLNVYNLLKYIIPNNQKDNIMKKNIQHNLFKLIKIFYNLELSIYHDKYNYYIQKYSL